MRVNEFWIVLIVLTIVIQPGFVSPTNLHQSLAKTVDNSVCDWPMDGKTTENIRVADDTCGPMLPALVRVWVNQATFSSCQPPVVSGNRMYCCSDWYYFYCLDALTGDKIWECDYSSDELSGFQMRDRQLLLVTKFTSQMMMAILIA